MTTKNSSANYIAVDLGASGGRVMLGRGGSDGFELEELHRFPNVPLSQNEHLYWDVQKLWSEIKKGISLYVSRYSEPLVSIGVDTWAVDYVLLDEQGEILQLPFNYRDKRTNNLMEEIAANLGKSYLFEQTGLQFLPFNTLYQLYSHVKQNDGVLAKAATLLLMPDYFHYLLSGCKAVEYTNATTTQFLRVTEKRWARELLESLDIPTHFLPPLVQPGTILGELKPELAQELGLHRQKEAVKIVAPGTHDTASAVAGIPYLNETSAYISSGTWSLVGAEVITPVLNANALKWNFTNEGGVANTIRLLKNVMGLWLVQECQRVWREAGQKYSWSELVSLAEQAPAFTSLIDPDAPDFLNPANMVEAIQSYCQQTGQIVPMTPGAIIRCCYESLALKYRVVLSQLETLVGRELKVIRVVGGGSLNEMLCQFTAEACNREVVAGPVEATALGNVLMQAIANGNVAGLVEGRVTLEQSVRLDRYLPTNRQVWVEQYARFEYLLESKTVASTR